ncbi:MAG: lysophospholipid acyltransferase family protein, partial [Tannerella sp.]|nr:lysophospholipid acyltransferase family protein [Tannerella sp.]
MKEKITYALLFAWVRVHSLLPMRALYVLADILAFITYYIVRYRRRVVRKNLINSFPACSHKEILAIERRFYRHFADYVVETLKLAGISEAELLRRAHITNAELLFDLMEQGHTCFILMMGHYGNWEWFSGTSARFNHRIRVNNIYRPLKNKAFDRLFLNLRTRFNAFGIKKNEAARDIIRLKQSGEPNLVVFVADQTPSKANLHYWTQFLNQDTAILTGPERIARKLGVPVIFVDLKPVRRGYYTVDFQLITDRPKETPENWITEQFARRMETCILHDPALWLWSHKRWKYSRD